MHVTLFGTSYEADETGQFEVLSGNPETIGSWVGREWGPQPKVEAPTPQADSLSHRCGLAGKLAVCTMHDCPGNPDDRWRECRIANSWGA